MKDHTDVAERHKWNTFKREYRKSHPTKTRNTQYYTFLRYLYKQQKQPNLDPWLEMSSHPVPATEQAREAQKQLELDRVDQEMGNSAQNIDQLRDYLSYLRHESNCPPHIIAAIQGEIFKLTLI